MTMRRAFFARTLPAFLAALAHLVPLAVCALLVLGAALSGAQAQAETPTGADPACRPGTSALTALRANGELPALEAEAAKVPNGEGRLFKVERAGTKPSWLFGTMHLSDPRILALPAPAEAAFGAAGGLVIETTDVLDDAAMAGALLSRPDLTTLANGATLDQFLSADELARVGPALEARAMPMAAVRNLQPWFLTMGLMIPACETARVAGGAKVLDVALATRAKDAGKTVAGLEKATEQLEALSSLPLDLQADNLVASLDLTDRLPDIFETMTDLYLAGRIALIEPATEAIVPSGTDEAASLAITQNFEERVVDRRNAVMAERLAPLLAPGGLFVAVGALHLPGEAGLVERLRGAGWAVTRAD